MKLEHVFNKSVFLAPKVYDGITSNYEYVKVKGVKNPIGFADLLPLLSKDKTLEIKQNKWYRNIANGHIAIKNEIYTLMITDNKRKLIYDSNNKFIDTNPLTLKNGKVID